MHLEQKHVGAQFRVNPLSEVMKLMLLLETAGRFLSFGLCGFTPYLWSIATFASLWLTQNNIQIFCRNTVCVRHYI